MRQLTFIKPGKFEWHDVPTPVLKHARDAIVRPVAVARCDLDLYITHGQAPFPGPFAMGHEAIAVVTDAGDAAHVRPGDVVLVPFQISCGTCANCARGWTNACTSVPPRACYGMKPLSGHEFGGAISEFMHVPFADHMLVKVPNGLDPVSIASVPDNVPDGWRAVAPHLKARPGANVLVIGGLAQSVGLYAVGSAVSLKAGRVLFLDDDPARRALATALGATAEPLNLSERKPIEQFEITVDASGNPEALRHAIASTAPNGVCTSVAIYYEDLVQVPMVRMYGKGITFLTGRVHARHEMPEVLEHIACGHFHPELVTTKIATFSEAVEAFGDPTPKVVFKNDWAA